MTEPYVGIDLGTCNTVISVIQANQATVIADDQGRRIHPSAISFHPSGSILVGQHAKDRLTIDPKNTIVSAKRLIGRPYGSEAVDTMAKRGPYTISKGENDQPLIVARGKEHTVSEISSLVLRYVKRLAELQTGQPIERAVITVPANFNDAQREATRLAGQLAGLDVLRILNEPTAAALAYGYGRAMTNKVVVYDFGGGTFDITLLQLDDRVFEVLATAGDTFLGGDDIDARIVEQMRQRFLAEHRIDLLQQPGASARLHSVAEQLKIQLSSTPTAMAQIHEIAYAEGGHPVDLEFSLTIEELDELSQDLIERSLAICDEAMRLAELSATQIDDVVMVGGTTRMPLVRRAVQRHFGIDPRTDINPDEVVAVGAAIQAAALSRVGPEDAGGIDAVLLDVTPRALGIGVVSGFAETIIERNAQIPVEQTRRFTTGQDNQQTVRIQVCEGESHIFEENQVLGELFLENIRPARRGEVQIEVTFEIDTDGILRVSAVDSATGVAQKARLNLLGTQQSERTSQPPPLPPPSQELPTVPSPPATPC